MTEPQISPLARRLAEENSIDWRVIPGTGPESRVIERDILTYLARIMSGEIDPPALPDASEPLSIGGAAPDLSEVSNLAAASAGMAKEGIDLSSLLGGVTPTAPSSFAPASPMSAPLMSAPPMAVTPMPVTPDPIQTSALDFQASSAETLPSTSLDFTFSDKPIDSPTISEHTSVEQISFDGPTAVPANFESPVLFSDPTPSVSPAKELSAESIDAEFEIDLDDFDDVPEALEVIEPALSAAEINAPVFARPEYSAPEYSFAKASGSAADDNQLSALESPAELTPDDLTFNPTQADPSGYQADLVLDIDSTSEEPLTIAALDASSEIDDDLVMTDTSPELETNLPVEAFNLEPVAFELFSAPEFDSLQLEPAQLEPVQLEPVQLEPAQFASASFTAPIEHDDFELDLIDADELSLTPAIPALESIEPVHSNTPFEPTTIAGGAVAAALVGGMLTSTPPLEPVDSQESALPERTPASHVVQPIAALEVPADQLSRAASSSSVANGFFQGFAVRRHFDASALTKMQHELTHALNGREVPLAVFLARAAQRNLHALGAGDVVTLTRLGDTLEPLLASGLHHSFIEAVQSVARATPGTMEGLLILDASSLGADDLVLPSPQPVLTLNVKGDYGHLALSGDLPMSKAAEFLGKVAQALETPVSLVI